MPLISACDSESGNEEAETSSESSSKEEYKGPLPVIFIHGMTGSMLASEVDKTVIWPPGGTDGEWHIISFATELDRISLNPAHGVPEQIYSPDVIRSYGGDPVYSEFLDYLVKYGDYVEYEVNGDPQRRTLSGAYLNQEPIPNLFVFAYDWRRSIDDITPDLAKYMTVVKKYHPDSKVNIVTHSMGGLVARRYILDNPDKVNKLITIAAPFLGSVKPLYQMIHGKITAPTSWLSLDALSGVGQEALTWHAFRDDTAHDMLAYYPGLHALMATKSYFDLGAPPFLMETTVSDLVETGSLDLTKEITFDQVMGKEGIVEQLFPNASYNGRTPSQENLDIHSYTKNGNYQDDWRNDSTGVEYHHLYSVRHAQDTPISLIGSEGLVTSLWRSYTFNEYGQGDGTVPLLSAERIGNGKNLNAPNAKLYKFTDGPDEFLEHVGIMRNSDVMVKVLEILMDEKTEPEPAKGQWRIETVDYPAPQGERIPWRDSGGSYALTVTAANNEITHVIERLNGEEVSGRTEISVRYEIPSNPIGGEMVEIKAHWTMKVEGKPVYTIARIEFRQGEFSGTHGEMNVNENPIGSMTYNMKVPGLNTAGKLQRFTLSANLRSTRNTEIGRIVYRYVYP
ncbi:alpha/beta fold hydrolase [Chloroflexota bacterium]